MTIWLHGPTTVVKLTYSQVSYIMCFFAMCISRSTAITVSTEPITGPIAP